MNLSITNACNRRCQYCFQKTWYLSSKANTFDDPSVKEMTLEEFKCLLKWAKDLKVIKLMGGEPLLHSKIVDFLEVAKEENKAISFISNISVDTEIFDSILPFCEGKNPVVKGFLVNSDFPTSQKSVFYENLLKLLETKTEISVSTTLTPNNPVEAIISRFTDIANIYRYERNTIEGLGFRLAPFCPNPSDGKVFKTHDFSMEVVKLINGMAPTGVQNYNFDCPVNYCEFSESFIDACRNMGVRIRTEHCSPATGMPFDVLVDHSVIWCSSANFIKLNDWRDYEDIHEAKQALSKKYYDWWRAQGTHKKCLQCEKFNPGRCTGFCIAKENNFRKIWIQDQKTLGE